MVFVPAARLEVVNSATPSTIVALPIDPPWSLKVTVPPFGVAPPPDTSLMVAVNVTDCPTAAEAVEALSAVTVVDSSTDPMSTVALTMRG